MRNSPILAALVIAAIPCALLAQRSGVPTGSNPLANPNGYTYGNILFPGGVPTAPKPGRPGNSFASSQPHGGQFNNNGQFNNGNNHAANGRTRTIVVPYAYPMYFGGDYSNGYMGYSYDQQYAQQQPNNVTVIVQQQPNPPVIINQNFLPADAGPRISDQDDPAARANEPPPLRQRPAPATAPQNDDQATIYLIALTNGAVYTAIGFGIIENTLTYTAPNGTSSRVSMDEVDRPLSERLNRERNVQFSLGTP